MAGLIPEPFIEELLNRTDIVEVIGRHVPLKPNGREYQALCPFHEEKTPSFTVSPQKQFYHCFGCGAHGSAIGFLMQFEGLTFPDAITDLAERAGIPVPREASPVSAAPDTQRALEALAAATRYYRHRLQAERAARDYLATRGVSNEMSEQFQLGFAPPGGGELVVALGREGFDAACLERAGLCHDGRDRFRGRLMFPIHDRRGRVIGFGGRTLGSGEPKYLNSPENPLFHKGRELYGLYHARRGRRPPRLIVVEGYLDVIALEQYAVPGAVATLGTATTADHVARLFQTTSEVVYCFDGDRAGRQAAWRALESTLPALRAGREVRFLALPEGEDPDTLVRRRSAAAFAELLDRAEPFSAFFFTELSRDFNAATIDGQARLVAAAEPLLAKMPAGALRDLMNDELARRTRHRLNLPPAPLAAAQGGRRRGRLPSPVRRALALIVNQPALAGEVAVPDLTGFDTPPGFDVLVELIEFCAARPHMTTAQMLELWRDRPHGEVLVKLATAAETADGERERRELQDLLATIEQQALQARVRQLADHGPPGAEALRENMRLAHRIQELRRHLDGTE